MTLVLDTKAQALRQSTGSGLGTSVKSRALAGARVGSQQRYIRAIADQIRQAKANAQGDAMDVDSSVERFAVDVLDEGTSRPARQGPFLLQPAPESAAADVDLGPAVEDTASDLVVLEASRDSAGGSAAAYGAGLTGLAVLWKEGRVDLCVELDKVEALWESSAEEVAPHALLLYESIDLGLATSLGKQAADILAQAQPRLTADPLDGATVYVTHAAGAHMIEAGEWIGRVQACMVEGKVAGLDALRIEAGLSAVTHLFEAPISSSECVHEVCQSSCSTRLIPPCRRQRQWRPLVIAADIRLPYASISCDAKGQAVVVALGDTPIAALDTAVNPANQESAKDAEMLLSDPFAIEPKAYNDITGRIGKAALRILEGENIQPHSVIREIGARDLRCLGKLAEVYATGKNQIEETSAAVEARLELQVLEMKRQLKRVQDTLAALRAFNGEATGSGSAQESSLSALRVQLTAARTKQADLLERLDGVTKSLMHGANPELSIQETKWIDELDRMKGLVGDAGSHRSVQGRIVAVRVGATGVPAELLLSAPRAGQGSAREPEVGAARPSRCFRLACTVWPEPADADRACTGRRVGQSPVHRPAIRCSRAILCRNTCIAAVIAQLGELTSKMSHLKMRTVAHVPYDGGDDAEQGAR